MPQSLSTVQEYLDRRLNLDLYPDRTGNGLLVIGSEQVHRIGAALNTSFMAITAAADAAIDLLLVHHAPWADIDLHLRDNKLARLRELGISLYAAHESLDRSLDESTGRSLANSLRITLEHTADTDLAVGEAPSITFDAWLRLVADSLETPVRAWPNSPTFRRVAVVPGAGGSTQYLAQAVALGCDTFLTGEGSLYTELFAQEVGLSLVYATHTATEFPSICDFTRSVAEACNLDWTPIRESPWITGGGKAPLEYNLSGRVS